MRNLILILLALFQFSADAAISIRTNFATSNLAASYSTSSPQKAICGLPKNLAHVFLYNGSSSEVAFNLLNGTSVSAPTADVRDVYLPANTGIVLDRTAIGNCIYQRSNSGSSITSGYSIIYPW